MVKLIFPHQQVELTIIQDQISMTNQENLFSGQRGSGVGEQRRHFLLVTLQTLQLDFALIQLLRDFGRRVAAAAAAAVISLNADVDFRSVVQPCLEGLQRAVECLQSVSNAFDGHGFAEFESTIGDQGLDLAPFGLHVRQAGFDARFGGVRSGEGFDHVVAHVHDGLTCVGVCWKRDRE